MLDPSGTQYFLFAPRSRNTENSTFSYFTTELKIYPLSFLIIRQYAFGADASSMLDVGDSEPNKYDSARQESPSSSATRAPSDRCAKAHAWFPSSRALEFLC